MPAWGLLPNFGWKEQILNYSIKESETLYSDFSALRVMLELEKKNIDLCIANPLETMDAPEIEAILVYRDGRIEPGPGRMKKEQFAVWFIAKLTHS